MSADLWTVLLLRGPLEDTTFGPESKVRAFSRGASLAYLHGDCSLTYNNAERVVTVHAQSWYMKKRGASL